MHRNWKIDFLVRCLCPSFIFFFPVYRSASTFCFPFFFLDPFGCKRRSEQDAARYGQSRPASPSQEVSMAWVSYLCVCVLGGSLWFGGATGVVAQGKSQEQCQASGSQPSLAGMVRVRDAAQLFFGIFVAFFFFAEHIFFTFSLSRSLCYFREEAKKMKRKHEKAQS